MPAGGGDVGGVVEGGPAHNLGIDKVLLLAADLPDAAVLALPIVHHRLGQALHDLPGLIGDFAVQQEQGVDGDDHLSEHVQLQMFRGGVADAHRTGVLVATEVVEGVLLEGRGRADAVDDLGAAAV